ncbi:MAG: right-handed parallel beta-helix repeat-containing protein [Ignavibacteriales bacterium]|nr:right-handed parallel beta-helix repeat-containing protein [Ignavibacteriales bacterium]
MKKLFTSLLILSSFVLYPVCVYAQITATWALTTAAGKTVVVTGAQAANAVAAQMVPGSIFAGGTHNSDGFACVNTASWPTAATDGLHLDFPLSPDGESILTITGLTQVVKLSSSSGNQMISLAYQADGTGSWIPLGSPQEAVSGTSTAVNFGLLNTEFANGHSYVIRMYVYAKLAGTSASRKVYIKNVAISATATSANTPVIKLSTAFLPSFGNVIAGNISLIKSYNVSGNRLTEDIVLTAQSGFQVSADSITFSNTVVIPQVSGTVNSTAVFVRFAPATAAGKLLGTISHASPGAVTKMLTVEGCGLAFEPTLPSTLTFGAITGNSVELTLSGGNGKSRIIVAHAESPVSWVPTDGLVILGENNNFSAAVDQGNGNKVVFNLPDSVSRTVVVTGLSVYTRYHFAAYEYNGNAGAENYLPIPGNGDTVTLKVPGITVAPSSIKFGNVLVATTSGEKSYSVAGRFLLPVAGSIAISAPSNFEISTTTGIGFGSTINLPYSSGTLDNVQIYVRLYPTQLVEYRGIITHTCGSAAATEVHVSGIGRDSSSFISRAIYVSPDGNDVTGTGTLLNPYRTVYKAGLKLTADYTLVLRGGIYMQDSLILRDKALTNIAVIAYPGEHPVIDGTTGIDCIVLYCSNSLIKGIEVTKAGHNGIWIMGHNNRVENCSFHDGGDSGLKLGSHYETTFPRNNLIINCDAYRNYDTRGNGGNADGFSAKWNIGSGNRFVNCRAWENSDDGWDLWQADSTVIMDSCWCFRNGHDVWNNGTDGNGNGFKIGGAPVCVPHIMRNCIAFDNKGESGGKGFDQNSNFAGHTMLNCLSFGNSYLDYNFYKPSTNGTLTAKNCVQYKGATTPYVKFVDGEVKNNTWAALNWQTGYIWPGFKVTDNDFVSVDTTLARLPRKEDGTLQVTNLFALKPASQLVNRGLDVGLPFAGSAPDLGPYELGLGSSVIKFENFSGPRVFSLAQNYPNPFNPTTQIQFSVAQTSQVRLTVYNPVGEEIAILVNGMCNAGIHTVNFNAANFATGIYYYRIVTSENSLTRKMLLVK